MRAVNAAVQHGDLDARTVAVLTSRDAPGRVSLDLVDSPFSLVDVILVVCRKHAGLSHPIRVGVFHTGQILDRLGDGRGVAVRYAENVLSQSTVSLEELTSNQLSNLV